MAKFARRSSNRPISSCAASAMRPTSSRKRCTRLPIAADASIALRPEWTAPVVRAALEHHLFAQGPQRLYYFGPIFRYERPQKGRYRQSHQFGVECFGYAGPKPTSKSSRWPGNSCAIYGIADAVLHLNSLGDAECRPRYREALLEHFRPNLGAERRFAKAIGTQPAAPARQQRSRRSPAGRKRAGLRVGALRRLPRTLRGGQGVSRGAGDSVFGRSANRPWARLLQPHGLRDHLEPLGAQSAVCGGGRYDGLVRSLGGPDVPAVGFALGLDAFCMMLEAPGAVTERASARGAGHRARHQARGLLVPIVAALAPRARRADLCRLRGAQTARAPEDRRPQPRALRADPR